MGDRAGVLSVDDPGGAVQISGALVIAQTLPSFEDFLQRSPGQRLNVGKKLEPIAVMRIDRRNCSLLEHDL